MHRESIKQAITASIDPALDIIMVTDTVNEVSSDVIVTVLPGVEAVRAFLLVHSTPS